MEASYVFFTTIAITVNVINFLKLISVIIALTKLFLVAVQVCEETTKYYLVGVDRKSKLFDPSRVDAVGSTGEGRMSKEGGLRIQLIQKCDRCLSVRIGLLPFLESFFLDNPIIGAVPVYRAPVEESI